MLEFYKSATIIIAEDLNTGIIKGFYSMEEAVAYIQNNGYSIRDFKIGPLEIFNSNNV